MAPRLEKKIYVMSCVHFGMHKHLFTLGLEKCEGCNGVGGGLGWQPRLCNQKPEPEERSEESTTLISANYLYSLHLVGHQ